MKKKKKKNEGKEIKKILIAGEGGQGVQTVAKLLNSAAYNKGLKVSYIPNYGVEQRGGVSIAFVQIQNKPVIYPKFEKGDLVIILSERSVLRTWRYVGPETIVIYNSSYIPKTLVSSQKTKPKLMIPVDATNIALNRLKEGRVFNIIILGTILGCLNKLTFSEVKKELYRKFKKKKKKKVKLEKKNIEALKIGMELVKEHGKEA